jgi:hypothetical protein
MSGDEAERAADSAVEEPEIAPEADAGKDAPPAEEMTNQDVFGDSDDEDGGKKDGSESDASAGSGSESDGDARGKRKRKGKKDKKERKKSKKDKSGKKGKTRAEGSLDEVQQLKQVFEDSEDDGSEGGEVFDTETGDKVEERQKSGKLTKRELSELAYKERTAMRAFITSLKDAANKDKVGARQGPRIPRETLPVRTPRVQSVVQLTQCPCAYLSQESYAERKMATEKTCLLAKLKSELIIKRKQDIYLQEGVTPRAPSHLRLACPLHTAPFRRLWIAAPGARAPTRRGASRSSRPSSCGSSRWTARSRARSPTLRSSSRS